MYEPPLAPSDTVSRHQQLRTPGPGWGLVGKRLHQKAAPHVTAVGSPAGADVLFRDRDNKGAEVGVTVSPVRVKSLEQFADVETAGSRLLQAESAKVGACLNSLLSSQSTTQAPSGRAKWPQRMCRCRKAHRALRCCTSLHAEGGAGL